MSEEKTGHSHSPEDKNYEVSDAKLRPIVISAGVLAGICLGAMFLIKGVLGFLEEQKAESAVAASPLAEARQLPPEPRLQVKPETDLDHFNAKADSLVSRYDWIVREAGVLRIPVERAMELVLKAGLPTRDQAK